MNLWICDKSVTIVVSGINERLRTKTFEEKGKETAEIFQRKTCIIYSNSNYKLVGRKNNERRIRKVKI